MPKYSPLPVPSSSEFADPPDPLSSSASSSATTLAVDTAAASFGRIPLSLTRGQFSAVASVLVFSLGCLAVFFQPSSSASPHSPSTFVNRIAYGSCTSYQLEDLPIFDLVSSSKPDYISSSGSATPSTSTERSHLRLLRRLHRRVVHLPEDDPHDDWLKIPPYSCAAGDATAAEQIWAAFLEASRYYAFQVSCS